MALWHLGILVVLGFLTWLTTWSIFGDRGWHRPRCPRCWHDMSGATSLVCSECGSVASSERALHRRRRHWVVAFVGVAAMLALALQLRSDLSQRGWAWMLPDGLAIQLLPWAGVDGVLREVHEELGERFVRGRLSPANAVRVLERISEGDDSAPPGTVAWYDKYGRLLERWFVMGRAAMVLEHGPSADFTSIEPALARLPPVLTLAPPAVWVVGEPVPFELVVQRPVMAGAPQRIVIEGVTLGDRAPAVLPPVDRPIQLTVMGNFAARVPLLLEALPAGSHLGSLRARVESADGAGVWSPVAHLEVPLDVRIEERIPVPAVRRASPEEPASHDSDAFVEEMAGLEEAPPDAAGDFSGVSGGAFDDAVRAFATPGLVRWASGERRFAMRFDPSPAALGPMRGVALGVVAEILEDGVPRRRIRLWWTGTRGIRFEPPEEDLDALERANTGDGRWSIRIRGDRSLALRSALSTRPQGLRRWWNGEVTIPLRIEDVSEPAPPRGWTIGPRPIESRESDTEAEPDVQPSNGA